MEDGHAQDRSSLRRTAVARAMVAVIAPLGVDQERYLRQGRPKSIKLFWHGVTGILVCMSKNGSPHVIVGVSDGIKMESL